MCSRQLITKPFVTPVPRLLPMRTQNQVRAESSSVTASGQRGSPVTLQTVKRNGEKVVLSPATCNTSIHARHNATHPVPCSRPATPTSQAARQTLKQRKKENMALRGVSGQLVHAAPGEEEHSERPPRRPPKRRQQPRCKAAPSSKTTSLRRRASAAGLTRDALATLADPRGTRPPNLPARHAPPR